MADEGSLEHTPTWVVASVCTVIVAISLAVERFLHYLGKHTNHMQHSFDSMVRALHEAKTALLKYLPDKMEGIKEEKEKSEVVGFRLMECLIFEQALDEGFSELEKLLVHNVSGKFLRHKGQRALSSALQKIKEELMLLGFISLLLTVSQDLITNICVPKIVSSRMLPCKEETLTKTSNEAGNNTCAKEGEVPLLSLEALHELHIFIFVLAVVHVVFCATTMVLGGAKMRRWKHWEIAIRNENENRADHHKKFVIDRAGNFWRRAAVVSWTIAFVRQFYSSVSKSDYRALRAGFISKHCKSNPKFDFHKYMMRTLEDDFKKVVGISWYLWLFVVIFLLLNVDGWHTYFWLSFLPLILLLIVGAKLEHIITKIAQEAAEGNSNERGIPADPHVRPSDDHFWFGEPMVVLYLIHFIIFQNSFEIAFFFWILTTYGFDSCIMESIQYFIPRLVMGVLIQVLCSYSTLPLYTLTQMGDMVKQRNSLKT